MSSEPRHLIRKWREHAKLTQAQMADAIGYERSYYSRVENGKRGYDQAILEKLAAEHGCSPADLLSRDPALTLDLNSILRDLSPDDLVRITEIARALRDVATPETPVT
ncbi:Predicted transcriptional regulator [Brevundimonas diminuta]|jgi:transcriptional regulator with XRE-family HTH domain|uniref:helix-turn-helix domain-containing protein n=1 Tax=Brevundimonas diminuta TaxID=293 RepID=UPI00058AF314|nr:helix-turn-helix transcriptional regulator [Brevundimonas diminuta]OWR21767.1 transcriptional regulator [Brevundimonas diminuta]WQE46556.1 helix-turn-helix transcriptional regulator [Brevundimonas diminuta]SPU47986.1 Predicted transcriptional regulator [Brevundimonas diminuta]SUW15810.1 Predicted transcriptional regulator [Brevundimonas diminuta]